MEFRVRKVKGNRDGEEVGEERVSTLYPGGGRNACAFDYRLFVQVRQRRNVVRFKMHEFRWISAKRERERERE